MKGIGRHQRRSRSDPEIGRTSGDPPDGHHGERQGHRLEDEQRASSWQDTKDPGNGPEDPRRLVGEQVVAKIGHHWFESAVHEVGRLEVVAEVRSDAEVSVSGQR